MERDGWQTIVENDFAVPANASALALAGELLPLLGSPDPELRDAFAYPILATWLHRGLFSHDEVRAMLARLAENLMAGIGTPGDDTVFLRTFSVLLLTEIVHEDNQRPFLQQREVRQLLELALVYLEAERDLRGWVPEKGWAHSVAHTADLLWVLARSQYLNASDLERILNGIAQKVTAPVQAVYVCDEDERLAQATVGALWRDLLTMPFLAAWLDGLAHPAGRPDWGEAFLVGEELAARHNTKAFLRSLYGQLMLSEQPPAITPELLPHLLAALKSLSQWYLDR